MTEEQPQQPDATQILKQLYEAIQEARAEIGSLKAENKTLKEAITNFDKQLNEFADGVSQGFTKRDEIINRLAQAPQITQQPQQSGGFGGTLGRILDVVEKQMSGGAGNGGGFASELAALNEANLKSMLQLQKLDFQALIGARAKQMGVTLPAEHVTVE